MRESTAIHYWVLSVWKDKKLMKVKIIDNIGEKQLMNIAQCWASDTFIFNVISLISTPHN